MSKLKFIDTGIRERILSFFNKKEGLIKSIVPKSYLDHVHYSFLPIAIIITFFTDDYYFFEDRISFVLSIFLLLGIIWAIVIRVFLYKGNVSESMKSGTYLDLSIYKKQLWIYRVLSGLVFFVVIGIISYIVFLTDFSFEMGDLFIYLCFFWVLIISGNWAVSNKNDTIKLFKIDPDKLKIEYEKGKNFVLLKDLKQIKITGTHLSFFPKEGKVEMLNNLELNDKEQLQLKAFFNEYLIEIPISIYEIRQEIFNDNNE